MPKIQDRYQVPEALTVHLGRLGRHVNHDPQSWAFRHVGHREGDKLLAVRHARQVPVFDQGNLGSCTGNAMAGALATRPLWDGLAGSEKAAIDEAFAVGIYSDATKVDPYDGSYPPYDTGSDGLSVAKVAKARGLISGYTHAMGLADALDALQDSPVLTGIPWLNSMDSPGAGGLLTVDVNSRVRGGHEVYADEFVPAGSPFAGASAPTDLVGLTNSWGPSWAAAGRFYLRAADWGKLLDRDGDVTIPLPSTSPAPEPTPELRYMVSPEVASVIEHRAKRLDTTGQAWLDHHLRVDFGIRG